MSKIHSYPWYPADWRDSETRASMTMEENAIYRELLDYCWSEGTLSTNPKLLIKLTGCTTEEWERSSAAGLAKFVEIDGRLHHSKVDQRRPELVEWHDSRRESGRQGGLKKAENRSKTLAELELSSSKPLANVYPSASASSTTSASSSLESGVQNLLGSEQDQDPDPSPPPRPSGQPIPIRKPKPSSGEMRRVRSEDMPQIPESPEAEAVAAILNDFGEWGKQLPPPDPDLVAVIAGELNRAGLEPSALVEMLKPRRDSIRNAKCWGLVITIVESRCRGIPLRPKSPKNEFGRDVFM